MLRRIRSNIWTSRSGYLIINMSTTYRKSSGLSVKLRSRGYRMLYNRASVELGQERYVANYLKGLVILVVILAHCSQYFLKFTPFFVSLSAKIPNNRSIPDYKLFKGICSHSNSLNRVRDVLRSPKMNITY